MLGHLNVHFGMVISDPGAKKLKKRVGAPNDSQPLIEKQCVDTGLMKETQIPLASPIVQFSVVNL